MRRLATLLWMVALTFGDAPAPPPGLAQAAMGKIAELKLLPNAAAPPVAATPDRPRPTRVGEHRRVDAAQWKKKGAWFKTKAGVSVWRLAVRSPGAAALRVHFKEFRVGEGRVWVHNGKEFTGPFTGPGLYGDGDFWAAVIPGERVVVEYQPPAGTKASGAPPIGAPEISHLTVNPLL
ncbi:MAG: hypothetical protein IT162_17495 [Bryobacterales bacterium]|nr:hypothetical protein [Bryobacterales bacterium]